MRASWLVAMYPRRWRDRYGAEFSALLESQPVTPSLVVDVLRGAAAAHATQLPAGGPSMRTRTPALVSLLALLLVLPAVTFLAAAMVRVMQPTQYQPAHAAQQVFDAFSALPAGSGLVLLGALPLVALGLSALVAWQRLRADATAREDVAAFVAGVRRILHQPALVVAALAFVASAAVLAFAIDHAIAG
ncbi:MAG TPA: hypothetical protein VEY67_07880 [Candidatus Dormibacteraeota bacterium]|nr:hypothetical protein [Candidatus Dormibacteraeota bacterium]